MYLILITHDLYLNRPSQEPAGSFKNENVSEKNSNSQGPRCMAVISPFFERTYTEALYNKNFVP